MLSSSAYSSEVDPFELLPNGFVDFLKSLTTDTLSAFLELEKVSKRRLILLTSLA